MLAGITVVQIVLINRFPHLLMLCYTNIDIGLELAKNIRNLFVEKFDLRKVVNISLPVSKCRCTETQQLRYCTKVK